MIKMLLTLPGSSFDRGTFKKHLFNDKLCRMEFCKETKRENHKHK